MSFTDNFRQYAESILAQHNAVVMDVDPDFLWGFYLSSFPDGTNPVHCVRTEHDCQCCKQFIRQFAGVAIIVDGKLQSIWRHLNEYPYQKIFNDMADMVETHPIAGPFVVPQSRYGVAKHLVQKPNGIVMEYHHLSLTVPQKYVGNGEKRNEIQVNYNLLRRGVLEIKPRAIKTVLNMIDSIYRGAEFRHLVEALRDVQVDYQSNQSDVTLWDWALTLQGKSRVWGTAIGEFLKNISDGMNTDEAVRRYEATLNPTTYRRVTVAPVSDQQVDRAKAQLEAEGLLPSLYRRFANIYDLHPQNVSWADPSYMPRNDAFQALRRRSPNKIEAASMDDFVQNVLPTADQVEVFFEGHLSPNLVSLIAPQNADAPPLFQWRNGFSWAYNGNVTDSMRESVQKAGGRVDGRLRFSIRWPLGTNDDYDAHCHIGNSHIYFGNISSASGKLDVDQIPGYRHTGDPQWYVENIIFPSPTIVGDYKFSVHNYNERQGTHGFDAELAIDGRSYHFHVNALRHKDSIDLATVTLKGNVLTPKLLQKPVDAPSSNQTVWGLTPNTYYPVSVICKSPNYWESNIGNEHWMLFMPQCCNPDRPNGFYQEFLAPRYNKHRQVLAGLAEYMVVPASTDQLSGLGFSRANNVTLRVNGSRIIKVTF